MKNTNLPDSPIIAIRESAAEKVAHVQIWNLCISYTMGRQNLTYSSRDKCFISPENKEIVFNLILNIYRNVTSRLAVAYPNVAVYPASPSSEDILKAQSSELALRYVWSQQDLISKYQEVAQYLITCGSAALYSFYDPASNDVVVKVVSPYDLFYEKGSSTESESAWVAVRYYANRNETKKAYPSHSKQIDSAPQAKRDVTTLMQGDLPLDTIELFDFYGQDGSYGISMGDEWLFEGEMPKGLKPVQLIKYTEIPGMLFGLSLITPLIDIQTQYNRSRNQIIKNTEMMANPKWMIPKTAGINQSSLTDQPGEKVYFNPAGGAPRVAEMPSMPPYVFESTMQLQNEMSDISGVHNISLGKRAIGISSGKAIDSLATLDSSQLQLTQNNIERSTKVLAKNILILMKANYTEKKFMRMMDFTGKLVFAQLSQLDIVEDPEVFIEAGTLFQSEIGDKEAKIMAQLQAGMITPQQAQEALQTRISNMAQIDTMVDAFHAQKIVEAVLKGHEVEIYTDDNLPTFKKAFKDLMQDDEKFYSASEVIQNYVSDLYKKIITAMKANQAAVAGGQTIMDHESIIKSAPSLEQNVQQVASMDSPQARGQLTDDALAKAHKEAELRGAMENREGVGPGATGGQ